MKLHRAALLLAVWVSCVAAKCPLAHLANFGAPSESQWAGAALLDAEAPRINARAVAALDVSAVQADLTALMTDSKDWWPADNGHYGSLMIRLAWHCSGSYRTWDGRGGCNGARIRFEPEQSWDDNTNLEKARKLLEPIKAKYEDALSWGDLIVLAGTTAIASMGGPQVGVCLGRIDDSNGVASLPLGPSPEQQMIAPCSKGNGMCEQPLGATTMGLIYVNPEGVNGNPVPGKLVAHIRSTFERMGMNDQETVALIGGGHAFGKTHGACPMGAGPSPKDSPEDPWPGMCGTGGMMGKGPNTFTSGFEGSWTTTPTAWDNEYFKNLLDYDWEKIVGPGGHWQWRPKHKSADSERSDAGNLPQVMMLTSDIALLTDPSYLTWVKLYAGNMEALTKDFGLAWYKLMTRSMGPATRCLGNDVPPPQAFQLPLPPPSRAQPNWALVRSDIAYAMTSTKRTSAIMATDEHADRPYHGALFAALAWQCASTFRATDYAGGCNGARIRFAPQRWWPGNAGLVDAVLPRLQPIKNAYPELSWADLIVLAGTVAIEQAVGIQSGTGSIFNFCPGRSDAVSAVGTEHLAPRSYLTAEMAFKDSAAVQGLTGREAVVLAARPRSPAYMQLKGYSGSWTLNPAVLTNDYFKLLLGLNWVKTTLAGKEEYRASFEDMSKLLGIALTKEHAGQFIYMSPEDMVIKRDPELAAIAKEYAGNNVLFMKEFASAWTKVMNADRFKGPLGNECSQ